MNKFKLIVSAVSLLALVYFADRAVSYVKNIMGSNERLYTELIGQQEKYKQLSEHAAKLEVDYASQKQLKDELAEKFANEKDALNGRIQMLSNATFLIRESARKEGRSDIVYQGDKLKYVVNEIRFNDGPAVGYVLIFDDGRVVSKIYNHEIQVDTAVARDEDTGRYSVVSKADYVLKSPSINSNGEAVWYNKPYGLKIVGGTVTVDPTDKNQFAPTFQWVDVHLNGGVSAGAGLGGGFVRPTVDVSMSGYGPSKNDLDWKFLHLGFDVDVALKDPGAHLMPFSYRFWPSVLSNTYAGPGLGFSKSGLNGQLNLNLTF